MNAKLLLFSWALLFMLLCIGSSRALPDYTLLRQKRQVQQQQSSNQFSTTTDGSGALSVTGAPNGETSTLDSGSATSDIDSSNSTSEAATRPSLSNELAHLIVHLTRNLFYLPFFGTNGPVGASNFNSPSFAVPNDAVRGDWWNGLHVCVEREQNDLTSDRTTTTTAPLDTTSQDNSSSLADSGNSTDISPIRFFSSFRVKSTRCQPTEDSFVCITNVRNSTSHMRYTVTYRCCSGFTLSNETNQCQNALTADATSASTYLNETSSPQLLSTTDKVVTANPLQDAATTQAAGSDANVQSKSQENIDAPINNGPQQTSTDSTSSVTVPPAPTVRPAQLQD